MSGLNQVGPTFVGLDNYRELFKSGDVWIYFKNTMILWIMCFIPQIFFHSCWAHGSPMYACD